MLLSALAAVLLLAIAAVQLRAASRALAARGLEDAKPAAPAPPPPVVRGSFEPAWTVSAWRADDDA